MSKSKNNTGNKNGVLILRLPNDLKNILQDMADDNNRKLGDFVRLELMKITNYVTKKK